MNWSTEIDQFSQCSTKRISRFRSVVLRHMIFEDNHWQILILLLGKMSAFVEYNLAKKWLFSAKLYAGCSNCFLDHYSAATKDLRATTHLKQSNRTFCKGMKEATFLSTCVRSLIGNVNLLNDSLIYWALRLQMCIPLAQQCLWKTFKKCFTKVHIMCPEIILRFRVPILLFFQWYDYQVMCKFNRNFSSLRIKTH